MKRRERQMPIRYPTAVIATTVFFLLGITSSTSASLILPESCQEALLLSDIDRDQQLNRYPEYLLYLHHLTSSSSSSSRASSLDTDYYYSSTTTSSRYTSYEELPRSLKDHYEAFTTTSNGHINITEAYFTESLQQRQSTVLQHPSEVVPSLLDEFCQQTRVSLTLPSRYEKPYNLRGSRSPLTNDASIKRYADTRRRLRSNADDDAGNEPPTERLLSTSGDGGCEVVMLFADLDDSSSINPQEFVILANLLSPDVFLAKAFNGLSPNLKQTYFELASPSTGEIQFGEALSLADVSWTEDPVPISTICSEMRADIALDLSGSLSEPMPTLRPSKLAQCVQMYGRMFHTDSDGTLSSTQYASFARAVARRAPSHEKTFLDLPDAVQNIFFSQAAEEQGLVAALEPNSDELSTSTHHKLQVSIKGLCGRTRQIVDAMNEEHKSRPGIMDMPLKTPFDSLFQNQTGVPPPQDANFTTGNTSTQAPTNASASAVQTNTTATPVNGNNTSTPQASSTNAPQGNMTAAPVGNSTTSAPQANNNTGSTEGNITSAPAVDTTVPPQVNSTVAPVPPQVNSTVAPAPDSNSTSTSSPGNITAPPLSNITNPPQNTNSTSPPNANTTMPPQSNATAPPGSNATLPPQSNATVPPESNTTLPPQSNITTPPQSNATFPPQSNITTPPQSNTTFPPQTNVTSPPQSNTTFPPQTNVTTPPQANITTPPESNVTAPPVSNTTSSPQPNVTSPPQGNATTPMPTAASSNMTQPTTVPSNTSMPLPSLPPNQTVAPTSPPNASAPPTSAAPTTAAPTAAPAPTPAPGPSETVKVYNSWIMSNGVEQTAADLKADAESFNSLEVGYASFVDEIVAEMAAARVTRSRLRRRRLAVSTEAGSSSVDRIDDSICPEGTGANIRCVTAFGSANVIVTDESTDVVYTEYVDISQFAIESGQLQQNLKTADPGTLWLVEGSSTPVNPADGVPDPPTDAPAGDRGGYDLMMGLLISGAVAFFVTLLVFFLVILPACRKKRDLEKERKDAKDALIEAEGKRRAALEKKEDKKEKVKKEKDKEKDDKPKGPPWPKKDHDEGDNPYRDEVERLLRENCPEMIDELDSMLHQYRGREEELLAILNDFDMNESLLARSSDVDVHSLSSSSFESESESVVSSVHEEVPVAEIEVEEEPSVVEVARNVVNEEPLEESSDIESEVESIAQVHEIEEESQEESEEESEEDEEDEEESEVVEESKTDEEEEVKEVKKIEDEDTESESSTSESGRPIYITMRSCHGLDPPDDYYLVEETGNNVLDPPEGGKGQLDPEDEYEDNEIWSLPPDPEVSEYKIEPPADDLEEENAPKPDAPEPRPDPEDDSEGELEQARSVLMLDPPEPKVKPDPEPKEILAEGDEGTRIPDEESMRIETEWQALISRLEEEQEEEEEEASQASRNLAEEDNRRRFAQEESMRIEKEWEELISRLEKEQEEDEANRVSMDISEEDDRRRLAAEESLKIEKEWKELISRFEKEQEEKEATQASRDMAEGDEWTRIAEEESMRVEKEWKELISRLEKNHEAEEASQASREVEEDWVSLLNREQDEADQLEEEERIRAEKEEAEKAEAEAAAKVEEEERIRAEAEKARLEEERLKAEKEAAKQAEAEAAATLEEEERIKAEAEKARLEEDERIKAEREAAEKAAAEAAEKARFEEEERIKAEAEKARLEEEERIKAEREVAERAEAEGAEKARLETEEIENLKLEVMRLEKARLEAEMKAAAAEQARLQAENIERERPAGMQAGKKIDDETDHETFMSSESSEESYQVKWTQKNGCWHAERIWPVQEFSESTEYFSSDGSDDDDDGSEAPDNEAFNSEETERSWRWVRNGKSWEKEYIDDSQAYESMLGDEESSYYSTSSSEEEEDIPALTWKNVGGEWQRVPRIDEHSLGYSDDNSNV